MNRAINFLFGLLAASLAGCADQAQVVYDRPVLLEELVTDARLTENQYTLLEEQATVGRFACTLAVARFSPQISPDGAAPLRLMPTSDDEQAYWCEMFRGLPAIQAVQFLAPREARIASESTDGLCVAAQRLGAALLLVYAPSRLGPNTGRVLGVVYDAARRTPIATIQTHNALLNDEGQEESPDELDHDQRAIDARYQSQRQFERLALACVRHLASLDAAEPTSQPHKWDTPREDRFWLPLHLHWR